MLIPQWRVSFIHLFISYMCIKCWVGTRRSSECYKQDPQSHGPHGGHSGQGRQKSNKAISASVKCSEVIKQRNVIKSAPEDVVLHEVDWEMPTLLLMKVHWGDGKKCRFYLKCNRQLNE